MCQKLLSLILFTSLIYMGACTRQKKVYSKLEMFQLAKEKNVQLEVILPKDIKSGVKCRTEDGTLIYGPGCMSGHQVKVGDIDMVVVEFDSESSAEKEARRLNQFYFYNWLFDDVTGEPALEKFVVDIWGAKRPEKLQEEEN